MAESGNRLAQGARVLGFVLLAPVGLLYLASGLVVPQPALTAMWVMFVAFAAYAVHNRSRPWRVLAVPVAATFMWVLVVSLGDVFLGWTA